MERMNLQGEQEEQEREQNREMRLREMFTMMTRMKHSHKLHSNAICPEIHLSISLIKVLSSLREQLLLLLPVAILLYLFE